MDLEFSQAAPGDLVPHPQNYKGHPADQLEHLTASVGEFGIYKNVVVASDGVILAGHGVVAAAKAAGIASIPVCRVPLPSTDPKAIKLLVADNEISTRAEVNHRLLSELLTGLEADGELLGTGYDEAMLQNLLYHTQPDKPASTDPDPEGLPSYNEPEYAIRLNFTFRTTELREQFVGEYGFHIEKTSDAAWTSRWPWEGEEDLQSVKFVPE